MQIFCTDPMGVSMVRVPGRSDDRLSCFYLDDGEKELMVPLYPDVTYAVHMLLFNRKENGKFGNHSSLIGLKNHLINIIVHTGGIIKKSLLCRRAAFCISMFSKLLG